MLFLRFEELLTYHTILVKHSKHLSPFMRNRPTNVRKGGFHVVSIVLLTWSNLNVSDKFRRRGGQLLTISVFGCWFFFFLFSFFFLDKSSNFSSDNLQSNETVEIIMTIVTIVCPLQGIRLACHGSWSVWSSKDPNHSSLTVAFLLTNALSYTKVTIKLR